MKPTRQLPIWVWILAIVSIIVVPACSAATTTAQDAALDKAKSHFVYLPKNDLELKNYNKRQEIADQPTTILWCTSTFNTPSSPMFTVAVVGKLTSGNKRPYATEYHNNTDMAEYNPELPGPDGMYGSSGEYRYGFSPAGQYYDFYGMPTFCTTEPMVWQRELTKIVLGTDPALVEAQAQAQSLLAEGKTDEANAVLLQAIQNAGGN